MKKALALVMMALTVVSFFVSCGEDPFFHTITIKDEDRTVETVVVRGFDGYTLPEEVEGIEGLAGWLIGDKEYNLGDRIEVTGDITITAIKGTVITITLYDKVTTHVILKKGETEFTLPVKPTRDGYDFDGWDVSGTVLKAGDKVTYTEEMTVSAVWTKLYYVTYYNGDTLVKTDKFRAGEGKELESGKDLKNGDLTFGGWTMTKGSETADFAGGAVYNEDKDVTLYAVWTSGITVIYKSDVSTIADHSETKSPETMTAWDASTWTYDGYVLDGWYTEPKGEGTYYAVGTSITEPMTLYAHWYNKNLSFSDGSGTSKVVYVTSGKETAVGSLVIPSVYHGGDVTTLRASAFKNCTNLTSVSFEKASNITTIASSAFTGCSSLTSIDLSETGLTVLNMGLFSGCSQLSSVVLPSTLTKIDSTVFYGCSALTSLSIPANVTELGERIFDQAGIKVVTVPYNTTTINSSAFSNASSLIAIYMERSSSEAGGLPTDTTWGSSTAKVYWKLEIGAAGPAGGFVAYDCDADNKTGNADGLVSDVCGWRYLECAPMSKYGWKIWGSDASLSFKTSSAIGTGKSNTKKLIDAKAADSSLSFPAAEYVWGVDLMGNGYTDWFLPSTAEMVCTVSALKIAEADLSHCNFYWTSTASDSARFAVHVYYYDGESASYYRSNAGGVNAVRYF